MSMPAATSTDRIIDNAFYADVPPEVKRDAERYAYSMAASLVLLSPDGKIGPTINVLGIDLSQGGILIQSRNMFHVGAVGGIELTRSDGSRMVVGVRVCHSRYVGRMLHHTGLQFIPRPSAFSETQP